MFSKINKIVDCYYSSTPHVCNFHKALIRFSDNKYIQWYRTLNIPKIWYYIKNLNVPYPLNQLSASELELLSIYGNNPSLQTFLDIIKAWGKIYHCIFKISVKVNCIKIRKELIDDITILGTNNNFFSHNKLFLKVHTASPHLDYNYYLNQQLLLFLSFIIMAGCEVIIVDNFDN